MIVMPYKTINLKLETYERLSLYKHGNSSFDDVLNRFMDLFREEEFYQHVLIEHRLRMAKIKDGEHSGSK